MENGHKNGAAQETGSFKVKAGLAQMLKGGVIMDVTNADQAKIAEDAGAVSVFPSRPCFVLASEQHLVRRSAAVCLSTGVHR